jgi:hypothetical protein
VAASKPKALGMVFPWLNIYPSFTGKFNCGFPLLHTLQERPRFFYFVTLDFQVREGVIIAKNILPQIA